VLGVFDEQQVYRIDHYLGKETVQNILAFRLGNSIFEPLWNRRYIEQVQILVAEQLGVEGRGGYYDNSGAIRDIIQNHVMQVLALIAMEPPAAFTATAVRNEKVKVLQSLRPILPGEVDTTVVRGQYMGYQHERGVRPGSATETYVALNMQIDNWRWANVPFLLRTGKAMPERVTEVVVQFRQPPLALFEHHEHTSHHGPEGVSEPNLLVLRIQPDEQITLRIGLKPPGSIMQLQPVELAFSYKGGFGATIPEAYERLILDAINGDATLFIRRDEVEAAWAYLAPILSAWASSDQAPAAYEPGSWGPAAANELIERAGFAWYESVT
jgi:glucose-6-phosphate 1-dehydrogenase